MRLAPARYIPADSQELKTDHGVVYAYENRRGLPAAIAYKGKSTKPVWHYSFRDPEQMQIKIDNFFKALQSWEDTKAQRRKQRLEFQHTLKVGDILYSSWGYEQTNINYYQVTRLVGKNMVELREVAQDRTYHRDDYGNCAPIKDQFVDNWRTKDGPITRKVLEGNAVYIDKNHVEYATPWDGQRLSWSAWH